MHHYWRVVSNKANNLAGCYQCSRRRIDCDRKEPECAKCVAKGVKCSGLGLRYRFNDGIAARGRFVGKTVPIVDGSVKSAKKDDVSDKRQKHDPFRESGYEDRRQHEDEDGETVEDVAETTELAVSYQKPLSVDWGLDHVDPKSRFCLGYCTSPTPPSSHPLTNHSLK